MDLKKTFAKPVVNGGVAALAMSLITGPNQKNFVWMGRKLPVWALGAALGIGSSFGTELITSIILPHIKQDKKLQHLESMVLHLAGSSAIFVGAAKVLNGNLNWEEGKKFAIVGGVSEMISTYVYENFLGDLH